MRRAVLRLCDLAATVAGWIATAMTFVMVAALLLQIFFRYVIGHALTGSEEIALLMFAWITLLLAGVGVHEDFHVRLTIGLNRLPAPARRVWELVLLLGIAAFGVWLAIGGWRYLEETRGQVSAAMGYPIELLHGSGLVCGLLIALQAAGRLLAGGRAADAGPVEPL